MPRSPSRTERDPHPPMSRALRRLMTITGMTGMDLARALDTSQSAVSRYYSDREPDYQMAQRIEEVLQVPKGTLFALAGYAPPSASDALTAMLADDSLTDGQKFSLLFPLLESLKAARAVDRSYDTVDAVLADTRVPQQRRRILAEMVHSYRAENEEKKVKAAARQAPKRRVSAVHSRSARKRS